MMHQIRTPKLVTAAILWLLFVEFLLGMSVNLFVGLPLHHPGSQAPEYFSGLVRGIAWALDRGTLLLQLHVALGLLLVVLASALFALLLARGPHRLRLYAGTGWIGITGAMFNGGSFINYGHDFSSMLMATGFAIGAASYVLGLLLINRLEREPGRQGM